MTDDGNHEETTGRARAALDRHDQLRAPERRQAFSKAEDTSAGCHALAQADRARSAANGNERMKLVLDRSAEAWEKRGNMFKRLEAQRGAADNG